MRRDQTSSPLWGGTGRRLFGASPGYGGGRIDVTSALEMAPATGVDSTATGYGGRMSEMSREAVDVFEWREVGQVGAAPPEQAVLSLVGLASPPVAEPTVYGRWAKPVFDRVAGTLLLVAFLPLLVVIALVVRAELGRGVLYRQRRVGRGGIEFELLKFRTMHGDRRQTRHPGYVGPDRRTCHKRDDDPRHTRVGRFLRSSSLDELPQLWNVLRGEMSLVGPRPELAEVVERFGLRHHQRHAVKPGITGIWQVSPTRSALLHEGMDIDLDYVRRITFGLDLKILLQTVTTVVRRTGA